MKRFYEPPKHDNVLRFQRDDKPNKLRSLPGLTDGKKARIAAMKLKLVIRPEGNLDKVHPPCG